MKHIDHKVSGGKLLRLQIDCDQGLVKDIRINGDFFVHPESAIWEIEEALTGCRIGRIGEKLADLLKERDIVLIGFSPQDLEELIGKNFV